jgi:superfamily II DNA or RNA helicase/DNA-binding XRE family transcriptional regulator
MPTTTSQSTNYATRVRELRDRLGLTQKEFADRVGVSFATVNRWENKHTTPSEVTWERIRELEKQVEQEGGSARVDLDFSGRAEGVRAVVDGERLQNGHAYNPTFATEISRIDPLPHQRIAVYERMIKQPRLRFLLADDAGAGKTIMTGLYIREMLMRKLIRRVLIVPPAGLVGNWRRELRDLFNLNFQIISGRDAKGDNPFVGENSDQLIVSVDTLARGRAFGRLEETQVRPYDLVVFDEAHKLSARRYGGEIDKTKRYKLAETVAGIDADNNYNLPWSAHHLLLLTATPHMGKDFPYYCLWRLLLPETLSTKEAFDALPKKAKKRHFIRRTKEEMVRYDGTPIYPTRRSDTFEYTLSEGERELYDETTDYLKHQYNQARNLNRSAVRLAMSVFQRRLVSSTYALMESFRRRHEKLEDMIKAVEAAQMSPERLKRKQSNLDEIKDLFDQKTPEEERTQNGREENEAFEEELLEAVASTSVEDLKKERSHVEDLVKLAEEVHDRGGESKFRRLMEILDNPKFSGEKILIFTEHRDTLTFLVRRLEALGYAGRIAQIHGGMPYEKRDEEQAFFRKDVEDGGAQFMVATDAAGEGINLQFCWLMVNYDLPWNPARLEQRMGRIHRYGQEKDTVVIINLVAKYDEENYTREGRVLNVLLEKLKRIRHELSSEKVFDVIGEVFGDRSIKEYVEQAIEDEEQAEARLDRDFTAGKVREVEERRQDVYGSPASVESRLTDLNEQREEERFRRVLPGRVQRFLNRALPLLDLEIEGKLDGEFALSATQTGALGPLLPVLERYPEEARRRLVTEKPEPGESGKIWLHPGEPVFDRISAMVEGKFARDAQQGAKFIDPGADDPYLLFFLRADIRREADEEYPELSEQEMLAERFFGLRLREDENFEQVDPEQMLTLRPHDGSPSRALSLIAQAQTWKDEARTFAHERVAEGLAAEKRQEREETLEERIRFLKQGYSHRRAKLMERRRELREQMKEGRSGAEKEHKEVKQKQKKIRQRQESAVEAVRREVELITPGSVEFFAHAVVIPSSDPEDKKKRDEEIEQIAVEHAIAHEKARGAEVTDVSTPGKARGAGLADWPGFDLLTEHPETGKRGIEVKGRARRGEIEISENEWASAINHKDDYWLYVVFECGSARPKLYKIQNPYESLVAQPKGGVEIQMESIYQAAYTES